MNETEHLNTRRCLFTNADRIRSMTDEELAGWIDTVFGDCEWCYPEKIGDDCETRDCKLCILDWLKQEVEA